MSYELPNPKHRHELLYDSDLTFMSFNMRASTLDTASTTRWSSRKDVTQTMLSLYQPDLIGLQESMSDQLESLEQLGYASFGAYPATSILYNRTKLSLLDGDTLWLSQTPTIPHSKSWDASHERVVTWILVSQRTIDDACPGQDAAQCAATSAPASYLLFNTHLDHRGEQSRIESCQVIKDAIHAVAIGQYNNEHPVFLTGDFNSAKYAHVWRCFTQSDDESVVMKDALHAAGRYGLFHKQQLQYTFHAFLGLQMNTWYMRAAQYVWFGFSHSLVKWCRHVLFDGMCCMGPSLYSQVYRRREFDRRAGIHHVDWIMHAQHTRIDEAAYFEVVTYHEVVGDAERAGLDWTLKGLLVDRIRAKTVYPSDHFPIVAGYKLKQP